MTKGAYPAVGWLAWPDPRSVCGWERGVAAAAVALGVVQLTAAFFSPAADARTAVGTAVINATPGPVKEWAILTFGTADKLFLSVAVIA